MSDDAERFRRRARECRELSAKARVDEVRQELLRLAGELEEEADLIEAEETGS